MTSPTTPTQTHNYRDPLRESLAKIPDPPLNPALFSRGSPKTIPQPRILPEVLPKLAALRALFPWKITPESLKGFAGTPGITTDLRRTFPCIGELIKIPLKGTWAVWSNGKLSLNGTYAEELVYVFVQGVRHDSARLFGQGLRFRKEILSASPLPEKFRITTETPTVSQMKHLPATPETATPLPSSTGYSTLAANSWDRSWGGLPDDFCRRFQPNPDSMPWFTLSPDRLPWGTSKVFMLMPGVFYEFFLPTHFAPNKNPFKTRLAGLFLEPKQ